MNEPHDDAHLPVTAPEVEMPEHPPAKKGRAGGIGAAATGVGLLLLKFKTVLLALLNLKYVVLGAKFFTFGWTFLLSLWLYTLAFGWRFGLMFVLVLAAHEFGHYAVMRTYGLAARLPVFIPFLGAFTAGALPADLEQDAYIALAGPLTGLGLAAACYAFGVQTHEAFWFAAAYLGAFLNLFNMIPVPPFDGGRVIGAIAPAMWIAGFALFIGLAFAIHIPLLFVIIVGLFGMPRVIGVLRGNVDPRAAAMTQAARLRVALWYLGTLFGLFFLLSASHIIPAGS